MKLWSFVVFFLAVATLLISTFILLSPIGAKLPGDGTNSAAISSSIAVIIATIGLVLALYMQSAEYRRKSEIVDGIQEIRMVLNVLAARYTVGIHNGASRMDYDEERQRLLSAFEGPAGRFLEYVRAVKDNNAKNSGQDGEKWRTIYVCLAGILNASDMRESGRDIVLLKDTLAEVTTRDIKKYSRKITSVASIDLLHKSEDPLFDHLKRVLDAHSSDPLEGAESKREEILLFGQQLIEQSDNEDQSKHWTEVHSRAQNGDLDALKSIYSIFLLVNQSKRPRVGSGNDGSGV